MIVLDAAAVPDAYSGARTRIRGLLQALARRSAPRLAVRIARGSRLLDGLELGALAVEETAPPGGPLRRAFASRLRREPDGPLARAASLWHSETIPPLAPAGVPALLTLHDLRWSEPREAGGAPWSKWAPRHVGARLWLPGKARALAGIVTVSHASARRIQLRLGVPEPRIHVVPNANVGSGVAPLQQDDSFALLARLRIAEAPFLLAVGHLEPRKGLELVLAALAGASPGSTLARARLVLVGAGRDEAGLRRRVQDAGLGERVVFAGALDDAETATLYSRAAALVFPSRLEGFGFPVHEALAHGCPVVARRIEVLADLESGRPDPRLTLLPEDAAAWTAALSERIAAVGSGPARLNSPRAPAHPWTWDDAAAALAALYVRLGA